MQSKRLKIIRLFPSLFDLALKIIPRTSHNFSPIPKPARWAGQPTCSDWRLAPTHDSGYSASLLEV